MSTETTAFVERLVFGGAASGCWAMTTNIATARQGFPSHRSLQHQFALTVTHLPPTNCSMSHQSRMLPSELLSPQLHDADFRRLIIIIITRIQLSPGTASRTASFQFRLCSCTRPEFLVDLEQSNKRKYGLALLYNCLKSK